MYTNETVINLLSEPKHDNVAQAKLILKNIETDWAKNALKLLSGDLNFERVKQAKEIVASNTPESSISISSVIYENAFKYSNLSDNGEKGNIQIECPVIERIKSCGLRYDERKVLSEKRRKEKITNFDKWEEAVDSVLLSKREDFGKVSFSRRKEIPPDASILIERTRPNSENTMQTDKNTAWVQAFSSNILPKRKNFGHVSDVLLNPIIKSKGSISPCGTKRYKENESKGVELDSFLKKLGEK